MLLENKVILITGATGCIGAAIAKRCVAEGAKVMLHGLHQDEIKDPALLPQCENINYYFADFKDAATYQALIEHTCHIYGAIHGVVNNAGISPTSHIDRLSKAQFDDTIAINTKAPLFLSKYAIARFQQQGSGGVILNIGSINAYCGDPNLLVYATSKGALMTITRNLATAHGAERIRINQLNVGWTLTHNERSKKFLAGHPAQWEAKLPAHLVPNGRLLRPDEIAAQALYWISDRSAPANGVVYELEQYPLIGRKSTAMAKSQRLTRQLNRLRKQLRRILPVKQI